MVLPVWLDQLTKSEILSVGNLARHIMRWGAAGSWEGRADMGCACSYLVTVVGPGIINLPQIVPDASC